MKAAAILFVFILFSNLLFAQRNRLMPTAFTDVLSNKHLQWIVYDKPTNDSHSLLLQLPSRRLQSKMDKGSY